MKFYLSLLFFICYTTLQANNNYYFQKITPDSDFTFGPVNTLCEDSNGFLWFGCNNGLYYHNTVEFQKVKLFNDSLNISQSILINKIYRDLENNLWICSEKGLFKHIKANNTFEHKALYSQKLKNKAIKNIIELESNKYLLHINNSVYIYSETDNIITNTNISSNIVYIHKDETGILYLGTNDGKVYITKDKLKKLSLLYHSPNNHVTAVCKDGNKYYVGYIDSGIDIINLKGTKIGELSSKQKKDHYLANDRIRHILKRKIGEIWIITNQGITILNQGKLTELNYKNKVGLPQQTIFSICKGRNKDIIVGTFGGGVAYFSEHNYAFKHVPMEYDRKLSIRSATSSFCEDDRGYIWIGNEDEGGIKVYDPYNNEFVNKQIKGINAKNIKSITYIDNATIAIGRIFNNQLILYNYKKQKIEQKIDLPLRASSGILDTKYHDNKLYLSGRRNLLSYDLKTEKIKTIWSLPNDIKGRIWQLYLDSSHNLWISTDGGLFVKYTGSDKIHNCFKNKSAFALENETIYSVCEDNEGLIWLGTKGKGLYIYTPENESVRLAPHHQKTNEADILSLIKDKQSNIWYNTNQGLYCYDVFNDNTHYYNTVDGLTNAHIRPNSVFCDQSGQLYIGSINGFNVISPNIIKQNPNPPSVYISKFTINNQRLSSKNIISVNSLNLSEINTIKLKSQQNTLGFKVVSNNYIKPQKNKFKYRLLNYDNKWIEIPQNRDIAYTKVPTGKYIFEVFGSNNDNVWSNKSYQLEITILPPYYRRWYAILIYIFIVSVIIFFVSREIKMRIRLKKEITKERYKSQTNAIIHSERIKFFTNISHELRTPLSLIISPIRSLLEKNYEDDNTTNLLKVIDRNAKRLLKLTDQTIDLRLLEVGKLKPNFEKHEIIEIASNVYLCFEQQIIDRQINFSFTSEFQKLETFIDGDMIEKIIYNLLSNALKYTPEKGHIFLSINKKYLIDKDYENHICSGNKFTGKTIEIRIRDTGKGIKPQLLPHIFERFTKDNESHKTSSGIGLHLCKEYSKMNDGNILLVSNEGIGSTFILNLPLKEDAKYEKNERKQIIKHDFTENENIIISKLEDTNNTNKHTLLITEDNDELRNYLKRFLRNHFKIITAKNGEQALDILENLTPDVIITDISMPGISGIELTKIIKDDPQKQHIAVIAITAHTERKYQMESILRGADAFLTKPIEESLLLAQINNILSKQIQRTKTSTSNKEIIEEESFIIKVEKIIENNFQNPQFGINDLLETLRISKSTLDRKIKAETQQNPSGFIRDVRLNNAVKLMKTNKFNIDEIATYVGFNSTSYFIRTFKIKYGVTPKEYRKSNDQKI